MSTLMQVTPTALVLGSTGQEVSVLQQQLNRFYDNLLAVDGIFGPQTEELVLNFQAIFTIPVDGKVGPLTRQYLERIVPHAHTLHNILIRGDKGTEVQYLQGRLNYYFGPQLIVGGLFDQITETQVKRFQSAAFVAADGIVGPPTWWYLEQPDFEV